MINDRDEYYIKGALLMLHRLIKINYIDNTEYRLNFTNIHIAEYMYILFQYFYITNLRRATLQYYNSSTTKFTGSISIGCFLYKFLGVIPIWTL